MGDYARPGPLSDASTVLGQLGGWLDDYNLNHPHSGFGVRSPREFIRSTSCQGVRINGGNNIKGVLLRPI